MNARRPNPASADTRHATGSEPKRIALGALITDGVIDIMIFFWDPLHPQPHDPNVKALLRIAVVWNIPVVCNHASADFIISSPLMADAYERARPDHEAHLNRMNLPG